MIHSVARGYVGRDAEVIPGDDGGCQFALATQHGWGAGAIKTWVDVKLHGKRGADLMPRIVKGAEVVVRGESWQEERPDGKRFLKMRADDVELCGRAPSTGGGK